MDSSGPSSSSSAENAQPGTSTSAPSQEHISLAMGLLAQGRRHLLVSDIPAAVETLEEACRMLAECYGETANECAESYYYYGMALMELARQESDVLGDAVEKDGGEDESSEEEEEEEVDDNKDDENKDDEALKSEDKGKSLKPAASAANNGEASKDEKVEENEKSESNEDVSSLQLAWEMLELAKLIYSRQAKDDASVKPRLADCLLRLAEVSIESENYAAAIEDLKTCLSLQIESLPSDSRSLAETHYQLGVAYTFAAQFDEALTSFQAAASVIELRIENLKKNPPQKEADDSANLQTEIEELSALLPDIRDKISETMDVQKEALRQITQVKDTLMAASGSSSTTFDEPSSTSQANEVVAAPAPAKAAATDISHLVRKKRKPEESDQTNAKKSRPDNS